MTAEVRRAFAMLHEAEADAAAHETDPQKRTRHVTVASIAAVKGEGMKWRAVVTIKGQHPQTIFVRAGNRSEAIAKACTLTADDRYAERACSIAVDPIEGSR